MPNPKNGVLETASSDKRLRHRQAPKCHSPQETTTENEDISHQLDLATTPKEEGGAYGDAFRGPAMKTSL